MSRKPMTAAGAAALVKIVGREIAKLRQCIEHGLDRRCEHCDKPRKTELPS